MARVTFEHVAKIYPNGTPGLVDCNLEVTDGELMVLVGPSGCGKSTLLRLLAGLEDVSSGTLRIGDRVANDLSPQERNVAMVFQDYALYPHMTVRGNLEFPLKMRSLSRQERDKRVAWVAELLDIGAVLDRLPKQLSGGQRQRVAMGRALVREPAVFLLDEPLSNLDAKLRVQVRAEIAELQQRMRTTMIYVTHDQTEAMTLGERVAVLNFGRLQQVAAPRELYDHPASAFVAGFIGNPPMNLFPTRLGRSAGAATLSVANQTIALEMASLPATAEQAVTAGIRPEAFLLAGAETQGALRVAVEHVEWLGHETLAYLRAGDASAEDSVRLVVRLAGMHEMRPGDEMHLTVVAGAVHLFDAGGTALR